MRVLHIASMSVQRLPESDFVHDGIWWRVDRERTEPGALRDVLSRFDVGHEIVLPERARSDHR